MVVCVYSGFCPASCQLAIVMLVVTSLVAVLTGLLKQLPFFASHNVLTGNTDFARTPIFLDNRSTAWRVGRLSRVDCRHESRINNSAAMAYYHTSPQAPTTARRALSVDWLVFVVPSTETVS